MLCFYFFVVAILGKNVFIIVMTQPV